MCCVSNNTNTNTINDKKTINLTLIFDMIFYYTLIFYDNYTKDNNSTYLFYLFIY